MNEWALAKTARAVFVAAWDYVPSKVKYIPIRMLGPEKTTNFYKKVVGIEETGRARSVVYFPDGYINLAIL